MTGFEWCASHWRANLMQNCLIDDWLGLDFSNESVGPQPPNTKDHFCLACTSCIVFVWEKLINVHFHDVCLIRDFCFTVQKSLRLFAVFLGSNIGFWFLTLFLRIFLVILMENTFWGVVIRPSFDSPSFQKKYYPGAFHSCVAQGAVNQNKPLSPRE